MQSSKPIPAIAEKKQNYSATPISMHCSALKRLLLYIRCAPCATNLHIHKRFHCSFAYVRHIVAIFALQKHISTHTYEYISVSVCVACKYVQR